MRINHVAIVCIDIDCMKNFFIKYFDAHECDEYHNRKTGLHSWMLQFTSGSTKLELITWPDFVCQFSQQKMAHINLSVGSRDKVNNLTKCMEIDGYQCIGGPSIAGDGYYESCILGPEDLEIEITI